jgi:hypothetical protein
VRKSPLAERLAWYMKRDEYEAAPAKVVQLNPPQPCRLRRLFSRANSGPGQWPPPMDHRRACSASQTAHRVAAFDTVNVAGRACGVLLIEKSSHVVCITKRQATGS